MVHAVDLVLVDDGPKITELCRHLGGRRTAHELLGSQAVGHEVPNRHDLEIVIPAELDQVRHARHRPIVVHDLADHTGRTTTRETREVDRTFGLADAPQHAAFACAERKDVSRPHDVLRSRILCHRRLDRSCSVGRRDARRHALTRFDRNRECGTERSRILVVRHHHAKIELLELRLLEGHADQASTVRRHEVDRFRRHEFRRHAQVALVLSVLVIDEDHHSTRRNLRERFRDRGERMFGGGRSRGAVRRRICRCRSGIGCRHRGASPSVRTLASKGFRRARSGGNTPG